MGQNSELCHDEAGRLWLVQSASDRGLREMPHNSGYCVHVTINTSAMSVWVNVAHRCNSNSHLVVCLPVCLPVCLSVCLSVMLQWRAYENKAK